LRRRGHRPFITAATSATTGGDKPDAPRGGAGARALAALSGSAAARALAACAVAGALSLAASLSPALGGYGFIAWAGHPTLALLGVWIVAPLGLFAYDQPSRERARTMHAALMACATALVLGGYAVAFAVHAAKGSSHVPTFPAKPLAKVAHVWAGLAVVAAFALQAGGGALRVLARSGGGGGGGGGGMLAAHSAAGPWLWAAAAAVSASGLLIPLVLKGGAFSSGVFLVCACAMGAAAVMVMRLLI
jgi:hypothetical protein